MADRYPGWPPYSSDDAMMAGSGLGRLVPVDEVLAVDPRQDVDRRRRAVAGADDRLAAPGARRPADDVHAVQARPRIAIGRDPVVLAERQPELPGQPRALALGQHQELRGLALAALQRHLPAVAGLDDGLDRVTAQPSAELGDLLAGDPLELRAEDLGDAEVIAQQRVVHRGLVLAEHEDVELVLGQEQRGAQTAGAIADHDHIGHRLLLCEPTASHGPRAGSAGGAGVRLWARKAARALQAHLQG